MATAAYCTTLGKAPPAANFPVELSFAATLWQRERAYIGMIETAQNVADRCLTHPQRGRGRHRAPVRRHRWSLRVDAGTELRERNTRYGVIGVCIGSGQGVAVVLENPRAS